MMVLYEEFLSFITITGSQNVGYLHVEEALRAQKTPCFLEHRHWIFNMLNYLVEGDDIENTQAFLWNLKEISCYRLHPHRSDEVCSDLRIWVQCNAIVTNFLHSIGENPETRPDIEQDRPTVVRKKFVSEVEHTLHTFLIIGLVWRQRQNPLEICEQLFAVSLSDVCAFIKTRKV